MAHNPDGYEPFLTQKFVKKMVLGQYFFIVLDLSGAFLIKHKIKIRKITFF